MCFPFNLPLSENVEKRKLNNSDQHVTTEADNTARIFLSVIRLPLPGFIQRDTDHIAGRPHFSE